MGNVIIIIIVLQVECFLWTPFNEKYRNGHLFISHNFACFRSHVTGLVSLVVPLKQVKSVERFENPPKANTVDNAILFIMKGKSLQQAYILANMDDMDTVIDKLNEMIEKAEVGQRLMLKQ